jgi:hypothetical protein
VKFATTIATPGGAELMLSARPTAATRATPREDGAPAVAVLEVGVAVIEA